jgi:carboxyl-terminal processing protease
LREVDLERHLSNDKQPDDKPASPKTSPAKTAPKPAPKPKSDDDAKAEPPEFGGKNDYQLNQALNLLKGLQILQEQK